MEEKKSLKQKVYEIRKEVGVMTKTKENPFFKSSYFDINDLVEHLEPILEKYKVMVNQPLTVLNGRTGVKTMLFDLESDEVNESVALLPDNLDAQKMGGAITFLRRYSLKSLLFLREVDDDANAASGKVSSQAPKASPSPVKQATATPHEPTEEEINRVFGIEEEVPFENNACKDCGTQKIPGKNGKLYCLPCYKKWAAANKR